MVGGQVSSIFYDKWALSISEVGKISNKSLDENHLNTFAYIAVFKISHIDYRKITRI